MTRDDIINVLEGKEVDTNFEDDDEEEEKETKEEDRKQE